MKLVYLLILSVFVLVGCSESPSPRAAEQTAPMLQCSKDTDCKDDRVCDAGQCTAPALAVVTPQPSAPIQQAASKDSSCPPSSLIFSCTTTKQKRVEVCDAESTINYSFGKLGEKPELYLTVPRTSATTQQWDGMGPMTYTVNIPNGKTVYSVFWSAQGDPEAAEHINAGIHVQIDGTSVTTVQCIPDTAEQNIEEIDLPLAQA